ncbi:hypothetical protein [Alkalimarinus sediminis]|uniref:Type II secretory pathway, component PulF n=1 Tax=Alkalimarinus sediminis TaxID=1632866 RepID=A0A9E8HGS2_9ALTE|nr:hypothetical protein [Alkalimarinus sediminis]UZW74139.1 hypothetical protein NNL22_14080 [Alkalimarinus sediminis]
MILNSQAQNDLNRIIRHIDSQVSAGLSVEESIAKLKNLNRIDTGKVTYLECLLKGQSVDSGQLSPYKLATETSMRKLLQLLVSSGASINTSLKALQVCLSMNRDYASQVWKGLKALSIYMFVILSLAFVCTGIYILKVLPQFQAMFDSMGAELPAFTQTVLGVSQFLVQWWLVIIPLVLWVVVQFAKLGQKIAALEPLGRGIKRVPGVKRLSSLHLKYLLVSYSYILMAGGLQSEEAFKRALRLIGETDDAAGIENARNGYLKDIFIARELGTLGAEIEYAFGQIEYEYMSELAKLREKIMLFTQVSLALIVGAVVIAMYLPIFQMGQVA